MRPKRLIGCKRLEDWTALLSNSASFALVKQLTLEQHHEFTSAKPYNIKLPHLPDPVHSRPKSMLSDVVVHSLCSLAVFFAPLLLAGLFEFGLQSFLQRR